MGLTKELAVQRVRRGAALLDEKVPDWYQRIATGVLSMDNACQCIIGQLFCFPNEKYPQSELAYLEANAYYGGYAKGVRELSGVDFAPHNPPDKRSFEVEHGFNAEGFSDREFIYLENAWQEEIKARKDADRV